MMASCAMLASLPASERAVPIGWPGTPGLRLGEDGSR